MKRFDVTALGELLIDFTESGTSPQGNALLEVNPGGAPCNVLAMLQRLGRKTAFIGKVGRDRFGYLLKEKIEQAGICHENLVFDECCNTTLTFVETMENGDRDFSFYRNPGADMMLTREEVKEELIRDSRVFHFGTLSMTHEGVREATGYAIQLAEKHQVLRSFDPNLRPPLWRSPGEARKQIAYGLAHCDILKISEEELEFVTETADIRRGVAALWENYPITLICVTCGERGSIAFYKEFAVQKDAYLMKNTVETTGAGDTFGACVIDYVLAHGLAALNEGNLSEMLDFANGAAALVTTRKGALGVMPTREEVLNILH